MFRLYTQLFHQFFKLLYLNELNLKKKITYKKKNVFSYSGQPFIQLVENNKKYSLFTDTEEKAKFLVTPEFKNSSQRPDR